MERTLKIEGMRCDGCVAAVRRVLSAVDGVTAVNVDLDKGEAVIAAAAPIDEGRLVAAVEDAGYRAAPA